MSESSHSIAAAADAVESGAVEAPLTPATALAAARQIEPWLVAVRRELHQHPELGLEERWTSGRIQELLTEIGVPFRAGLARTGVVGTIGGRSAGPAVALRADIDGLPLTDAKDVPYRSRVEGMMHACGHDVHTTVLLGAARILAGLGDELAGTVRLIFQPAEETVGGAELLIAEGVLEDPPVDAIFGLHVEPRLDVGKIGLHYGHRNAASDSLGLVIHGRAGHGAYPAGTVDAVVVAAHVVTALQTVVSRNVDPRRSAVVSFGTIHGGGQQNIVANRVELSGTVRTLDPETRELVLERVRRTAEGVAAGFGARAELEIEPGYDALINDDRMVEVVRANAAEMLGEDHLAVQPEPNMGVEDFAYYVQKVPGAFYSLGVRNEEKGIVHSVHHDRFDVDESCLAIGAAVQAMNALAVLRG